jgi:mannosylglycerate hydrolase MGH1-like protein
VRTPLRFRIAAAAVLAAFGWAHVPARGSAAAGAPAGETTYSATDDAITRLLPLLRASLEANRKEFRGRTGLVRGFGAGSLYPQVWLRDSATLLPATRYLYSRDHLTSWIEEHLAHQRSDGSLQDWIAAGEPARFTTDAPKAAEVFRGPGIVLSGDRNTSESDQESSAVLAAAQVFALTGDRAWLRRSVAGRPLLTRLDAALEYVLARRFDRERGLVTTAFTADWGDVTPARGDQLAIYRDEGTPAVASLYATSLYAGAAREIGGMHRAIGDAGGGRKWDDRSSAAAAAIERELWQPKRGFYRVHVVSAWPGPGPAPQDDDRFAMGGNATALLAGLGDDDHVRRVVGAAQDRQRRFHMSTISGVLLPPYPSGFFRHPILREEFAYQNGGEWDWWGGRLLLAAFQRGQAAFARRELSRIAAQAVRAGGLYEWSTRDGQGRGSSRYAGSAGALGGAIMAGLYGIDLRHDRLDVHVRLADMAGRVRAMEPATGATVAYEYAYDASARRVTLRYEASRKDRGTLEVLLPAGRSTATARVDGGEARPLDIRAAGEDRYARLETDWAPHRLELTLR